MPPGWLATPRAQRAAACLKRLLKADQNHQSGPWAIKDPRTSLLLPLWRQVADELHQPLRLLLAIPAAATCALVTPRLGGHLACVRPRLRTNGSELLRALYPLLTQVQANRGPLHNSI